MDIRRKQFLNCNKVYGGPYIDRARRKYRNIPDVWEYKVLAYCDISSLNLLERAFIAHFYYYQNLLCTSFSNKEVIQKDLDGNTIAEYRSTREAEEHTGINHVSISLACRGKNGTSGHGSHRFLWFYKNNL